MKKRVITGLIMAVVLVPAVLIPACLPVLEFLIAILIVVAEIELLNMYDKEKKIPVWLKILTVLLTLGLSFSVFSFMQKQQIVVIENGSVLYREDGSKLTRDIFNVNKSIILTGLQKLHFDLVFTPVTALLLDFIVLMTCMIFVHDFEVKDAGRLYLSIIYVGVCSAAVLTLRFIGRRFILYLLLITVLTDIFALVFGLTLGKNGKHKMAPHISPKKSWEGAIGGTITAVIVGFLFAYFYPTFAKMIGSDKVAFFDGVFNYTTFTEFGKFAVIIVLTLFLSITSQVGDLVASKLKRAYGIKDYSQVFPGHGGVLDRFDSVFFASAMFLTFIIIEINFVDVLAEAAGMM